MTGGKHILVVRVSGHTEVWERETFEELDEQFESTPPLKNRGDVVYLAQVVKKRFVIGGRGEGGEAFDCVTVLS